MNQNDFMRQQQAAVERMREMNARAKTGTETNHKMPPVPPFVRVGDNSTNRNQSNNNFLKTEDTHKNDAPPQINNTAHRAQKNNSLLGGLNIPVLDSILRDGDSTLIIGLLLLLMSEKSDKLLLFALVYILL